MRKGWKKCLIATVIGATLVLNACSQKESGSIQFASTGEIQSEEPVQTGVIQQQKCLRLYLGEISEDCSPFFYLTEGDRRLLELLYMRVCRQENGFHSSGKSEDQEEPGQMQPTTETGGQCAATVSVIRGNGKKKSTIYRIFMKENVRDSQGNLLTAEDLIYNYYLRCQLDYTGMDQIQQMKIQGLEEYQYGASGKKLIQRKKQVKRIQAKPGKKLQKKICDQIILPVLRKEYAWLEAMYEQKTQKKLIKQYPKVAMLFARYYAPNTKYTGKGKSKEKVLREVAEQYQGDTAKLSRITGESYSAAVTRLIIRQLWPKQNTGEGKIAGIRKVDGKTIEIETADYQKKDRQRLGEIYLVSRHTQGKGESSLPAGSGFYYLEKETKGGMLLRANDYYREGRAQIQQIHLISENSLGKKADIGVNCVRQIAGGSLDMAIVWERLSVERKALRNIMEKAPMTWQVAASGGVLYSTSRVNGTTLPEDMTSTEDVIQRMDRLRLND